MSEPEFIRIRDKSDTWNHPAGMWWDDHIGEVFSLVKVHDGIPRQYEVDVSSFADEVSFPGLVAYVPVTYADALIDAALDV